MMTTLSYSSKSKEDMVTKCIYKFKDRPGSSAKSLNRKPLKAAKVPYCMYILLLFPLTFLTIPGDKSQARPWSETLYWTLCRLNLESPVSSEFQRVQRISEIPANFRGRTTEHLTFYGLKDKYWGCDYSVLFRNYMKVWT